MCPILIPKLHENDLPKNHTSMIQNAHAELTCTYVRLNADYKKIKLFFTNLQIFREIPMVTKRRDLSKGVIFRNDVCPGTRNCSITNHQLSRKTCPLTFWRSVTLHTQVCGMYLHPLPVWF